MNNRLANIIIILVLSSCVGMAQTTEEIFQKYAPKVCLVQYFKNVSTQSQIGSYMKVKQNRIGILVSSDGLVMVNSDVYPLSLDIISGNGASFYSGEPSDFKVKLYNDEKEYEAEFKGKDDNAQVAFVQITENLPKPLPYVHFESSDGMKIGQTIYLLELLGENYSFERLFTPSTINGIITDPRKKFLIKNDVTALSAGGLVINHQGEAIGVTLRKDYDFQFRTPTEFDEFRKDFLEIAPSEWFTELIKEPPELKKSVNGGKAWLGIGMQALTPELKNYWKVPAEGGIVIDRVYPNSPAEKSGLQAKDVIIRFDKQDIDIRRDEDLNRFREMVAQRSPGEETAITFFREGQTKEKKVKFEAAPRAIDLAEKYQSSKLGIEVRKITLDILYDYDFPLDMQGVYVYQVDRASPAGLAGLEVGSIITHVNEYPIKDLKSFQETIEKILEDDPEQIMFRTQQHRETQFVFVELK